MLRKFLIANCLTLALCASAIGAENADTQKYAPEDFRNYFGLAWNSTPTEILQYCKNVGHTCVMYKEGMERNPLSDGMTFVIETPEYAAYRRTIDLSKKYTKEEIAKIESLCAVAFPEKPFPQNMATGWFFNKNQVSMQLDMQQKAVHDIIIKRIFERVEKSKSATPASNSRDSRGTFRSPTATSTYTSKNRKTETGKPPSPTGRASTERPNARESSTTTPHISRAISNSTAPSWNAPARKIRRRNS